MDSRRISGRVDGRVRIPVWPDLSNIMVLELRLDYLVHGCLFIPVVALWRWAYPGHTWRLIKSKIIRLK